METSEIVIIPTLPGAYRNNGIHHTEVLKAWAFILLGRLTSLASNYINSCEALPAICQSVNISFSIYGISSGLQPSPSYICPYLPPLGFGDLCRRVQYRAKSRA
jgi:hypothetical protein